MNGLVDVVQTYNILKSTFFFPLLEICFLSFVCRWFQKLSRYQNCLLLCCKIIFVMKYIKEKSIYFQINHVNSRIIMYHESHPIKYMFVLAYFNFISILWVINRVNFRQSFVNWVGSCVHIYIYIYWKGIFLDISYLICNKYLLNFFLTTYLFFHLWKVKKVSS